MSRFMRLEGALPPEFSHPLTATGKPVRFRLDGRTLTGLEGDTVLSAALASGIDTLGTYLGHPLALSVRAAPAVIDASNIGRPDLAVPMALCPVAEGMELVTLGHDKPPKRRPTRSGGASLNVSPRFTPAFGSPWVDTPAQSRLSADLAVVGGGVAGLSAALAAAERGLSVVLVEREAAPGGLSGFFGREEGQPRPDTLIAELADALAAHARVTLLSGTVATGLAGGNVRAVSVAVARGVPSPHRTDIAAPMTVLATGARERLPIFPGNRLPGLVLSSEAWRLAAHHNLWPGQTIAVHTTTNAGYRMALLGSDSRMRVTRTTDARSDPRTRFIDFCKAYGFRLSWGVTISAAEPHGTGLRLHTIDTLRGKPLDATEGVDAAILAGGWQPDLRLWLDAGGDVAIGPDGALIAHGPLPSVALAGAAAGYLSLSGCADSGRAAVAGLLGEPHAQVEDPRISEDFESPDAPATAIAPHTAGAPPAFLSASAAFSARTAPARPRWRLPFLTARRNPGTAIQARALCPDDVAGQLAAGLIAADLAPAYARERSIVPRTITAAPPGRPDTPAEAVPGYLTARFGPGQQVCAIAADDGRRLEIGSLIFANSDDRRAHEAIGVVLAPDRALTVPRGGAQDAVYVREGTGAHRARLASPPDEI